MKFIVVEKSAAKTLVAIRTLQSTEYKDGLLLTKLLTEGTEPEIPFPGLSVVVHINGILIIGSEENYNHLLIFDMELFAGFSGRAPSETLLVFQKSCRTALKYWEKIPFSGREWLNSDMHFVVLAPQKNSRDKSRVVIDTKPDWQRQERRNTHHLLAFYYGAETINSKPSYTNFRKALDVAKGNTIQLASPQSEIFSPLPVQKLDDSFRPIDSNTDFETWKSLLTTNQSDFVFRNNFGPERIEGAAGTGKTLSLSLRCCHILQNARDGDYPLKAAFITHSQSSKEYIENIIVPKIGWYSKDHKKHNVDLMIITLQEWCIQSLGNKVEETELLDKDAQNSKDYQQMLIADTLGEFKSNSIDTHRKFISDELYLFLSSDDENLTVQALQYEIAEVIKGRSSQDLEKYKKTSQFIHPVPVDTEKDFECIFGIYTKYQEKLQATGYFDSDDIILSALGQLDSPIWRRRKNQEGFDVLFIDETHLFNLNELSIMHYLLKDCFATNVIYSIDRSQSLANLSLETDALDTVFNNSNGSKIALQTMFRSSPDIVRLAFSVLSSGATLFTNMENPLDKIENSFTSSQEVRSVKPYFLEFDSDEKVIAEAYPIAERLAKETQSKKCRILIIATTEAILSDLERYARESNKPVEFIKRRGDKKAQSEAEKGNKYIVSGIDYVGGLEFDGVVIVGADKGHLPATEEQGIQAKHFLNHASYNRIYVAITRAKYGVAILCSSARGLSQILEFPLSEDALRKAE